MSESRLPFTKRLIRFVVTGAAGAGKSTLIEIFRKEWEEKIQFVPEVATMLITQLRIIPGTKEASFVHTQDFGHLMYHTQLLLEQFSEKIAKSTGKIAIMLDKARLDVLVHFLRVKGSIEEYEKYFHTTLSHDYGEYDVVLFLGLPEKDIYERIHLNNPARGETYEDSKSAEEIYLYVWQNHPHFIFIPNKSSWEETVESARHAIHRFLHII